MGKNSNLEKLSLFSTPAGPSRQDQSSLVLATPRTIQQDNFNGTVDLAEFAALLDTVGKMLLIASTGALLINHFGLRHLSDIPEAIWLAGTVFLSQFAFLHTSELTRDIPFPSDNNLAFWSISFLMTAAVVQGLSSTAYADELLYGELKLLAAGFVAYFTSAYIQQEQKEQADCAIQPR